MTDQDRIVLILGSAPDAWWAQDWPRVIAWLGCDMIFAAEGRTFFYGDGAPDPLRDDISLRSLEAKSARLMLISARQGAACVNLSEGPSRLVFPRARPEAMARIAAPRADRAVLAAPLAIEAQLGCMMPSGRYWEQARRFDRGEIDRIEALWLDALHATRNRGEPHVANLA